MTLSSTSSACSAVAWCSVVVVHNPLTSMSCMGSFRSFGLPDACQVGFSRMSAGAFEQPPLPCNCLMQPMVTVFIKQFIKVSRVRWCKLLESLWCKPLETLLQGSMCYVPCADVFVCTQEANEGAS